MDFRQFLTDLLAIATGSWMGAGATTGSAKLTVEFLKALS